MRFLDRILFADGDLTPVGTAITTLIFFGGCLFAIAVGA